MADFGLAAQIGRGGGMGGGVQPADPTNRMLQMMQLQQMQQNMMLAREQAAREAEKFPMTLDALRAATAADVGRLGLTKEQTGTAREQRLSAERAGRAEVAALDYIAKTPAEQRADPARLDALRQSEPGAYNFMLGEIAKVKALQEEARVKNFSAEEARFKFDQLRLSSMSSLLPAVNEQTWPVIYSQFRDLDPIGARVIGSDPTPENLAALRARIQDRADLSYEKDEEGNPFIVNKRTNEKTPVVQRGPNPPATARFGTLDLNLRNPSSQMIGQGAAALASPNAMLAPGETPIIQPRAAAPAAPEAPAGLGPKAVASFQATVAKKAGEEVASSAERRATMGRVLTAISDPNLEKLIQESTSGGLQRRAADVAGFFGQSTSGMENIGQLGTIGGQLKLDLLGGKLGGGISDNDVKMINETVGLISDPNIPADQRLAAFRQLKANLQAISEGKSISVATPPSREKDNVVDKNNPLLGDLPLGGRR